MLTIKEKQQLIKYCRSKIIIAKRRGRISRLLAISISGFSLVLGYSLLEKIIDDNLLNYAISLAIFWRVNSFFLTRFWRVGEEETNYQTILQMLLEVD